VEAIDERQPDELERHVEAARKAGHSLVLVAGVQPFSDLPAGFPLPASSEELRVLGADLRHPEHLRALLGALAVPAERDVDTTARPRVDKDLIARVRGEVDGPLSDHDAKRLLKAYGARVTRQAPTSTPTGAAKVAQQIGLPVVIASATAERVADTLPDVRRVAALFLQSSSDESPSVMVRERFPEVPRARVAIQHEKELGLTMRVASACALLPLRKSDGESLAQATAARRAADQHAVADMLAKIAACAVSENAELELEIYVGSEPAVLAASGALRRPT
jgi:hypothetical protein